MAVSNASLRKASFAIAVVCSAFSPQAVAGDDLIYGFYMVPLNSTTQASIDAGMAVLSDLAPDLHADLHASIISGAVDVTQLTEHPEILLYAPELATTTGFKGASDGDTISVRLEDGVNAQTVAIRLRHEYYHWKYGSADSEHNGGIFDSCSEALNWAETVNDMAKAACDLGYPVGCAQAYHAYDQVAYFYNDCVSQGGSPPAYPTMHGVCCQ